MPITNDLQVISFGLQASEDLLLFKSVSRVKKGHYLHVRMERNLPMVKAFKYFCEQNALNPDEISFFLGKRELKLSDCPQDVFMKNDDIIHIVNKKVEKISKVAPSTYHQELRKLFETGDHSDVSRVSSAQFLKCFFEALL
jgi:hypothetical protein